MENLIKLTKGPLILWSRVAPIVLIFVDSFFLLLIGIGAGIGSFLILIPVAIIVYHFFVHKGLRLFKLVDLYISNDNSFFVTKNLKEESVTITKDEIVKVKIRAGITILEKLDGTKVYFMLTSQDDVFLFE
ncbi:hypothetical protein [Solitalea canadensis]|uniref:DUF304 domain-containing protein n=1 Tax=Solitalea canadensis (strain ATCC 29591 / DSM 3403 / JCM 21819 / LMG 8368 / NBRC 15130 / NCIMB 12057 / USAM 9D) TaxID=929556 RepID=H8KV81_SOLCM|nr:hypothetical protein [Solitalea canadensis]AFD06139.1 hypothetical protein Solca_1031 [Solitalea canadensis DSM 3403]